MYICIYVYIDIDIDNICILVYTIPVLGPGSGLWSLSGCLQRNTGCRGVAAEEPYAGAGAGGGWGWSEWGRKP